MLQAAQSFIDKLNERELNFTHYDAEEGRAECLRISFGGDHGNTITLNFFFDEDGTSVGIRGFSIAKAPEEKLVDMYKLLNDLNCEYRWVKFYLDSDDEVTVAGDAVIDPPTAGEELVELMYRYVNVVDEIYPRLMKVLWA